MAKSTKVKTKVSEFKFVFIDGGGRDQSMPGEEPRMQFLASIVCPKDGPVHKDMLAQIDAEWVRYKAEFNIKGLPKTNGIKDEMKPCESGEIDPATEKIKKVPTGNVLITFKTNTLWPDGNPQVVKVKDKNAKDITTAVHNAPWSIGDGTTGIIHGSAAGNSTGGTQKVTLYLAAVQIGKLVKYEGSEVEADEIEGDEIDLGDEVSAIEETAETKPDL